jgi:WD40 repeat protein
MKLLPLFLLLSFSVLAQDEVSRFVPAHTDDITCLTYSPDGKFIVSGGWDNTVSINRSEGDFENVQNLKEYKGAIKSLAFSRDGYKLIVGGQDGRLSMYNFNKQKPTPASRDTSLLINESQINKLIYGPGMRTVFSAGDDGRFLMYDLSKEMVKVIATNRPISAASVSIDRRNYFIANEGNATIYKYDVFGNIIKKFEGHKGDITDMAVTVDRKHLITSSEDKTVKVWDIVNGKLKTTFHNHEWAVTDIDVDLFGKYLVSCGLDGTVNIYNLKSSKLVWTKTYTNKKIQAITLSPDLTTLAVAVHSDDINATGYYLEDTKLKARKVKLPKQYVVVKKPKVVVASTSSASPSSNKGKSTEDSTSNTENKTPKPKKPEKEVVEWEDQILIKIEDDE